MKLQFLASASLLVSLIAHIASAADSVFQAGAALSNITPKMGVPLDGTITQNGPAKGVHDELWARCIVVSDGKKNLAFAVVDNTMVSREIHDAAKREIEKRIGIPPSHVSISATHTHSTPRAVTGLIENDLHREYLEFLAVRIADGIVRAHQNLTPAEFGFASFKEPRYVFNRRWHVKEGAANPFGQSDDKVKMNPGRDREILDRPSGPADAEVCFIAMRRKKDGQPIALLANYGLHYVGGIPRGFISADYFGVFAGEIQKRWQADRLAPPFVCAMSNGTSGDVNANNPLGPRQKFAPYERMTQIAVHLAEKTETALKGIDFQSEITLDATARELTLRVRKPDENRLAWARKTQAPTGTKIRLTRPQVYARESLHLANYPDTVSVPVQAFRIGSVAIAQSPCETFAATGLKIKSESPFAGKTFTIELANGYAGYLPPQDQFKLGGYETWPARSSFLEESAEDKIRSALVALLESLHKDRSQN